MTYEDEVTTAARNWKYEKSFVEVEKETEKKVLEPQANTAKCNAEIDFNLDVIPIPCP